MAILHVFFVLASVLHLTLGYELKAKYNASNFFDNSSFQFYTGNDRFTDGFALYVSKEEATSLGLAQIKDNKVYVGVDTASVVDSPTPGQGKGRKSIRLEGIDTFDGGLIISDFDHLPSSACGQWPAFWLLHDDHHDEHWYSEIDLIEGLSLNTWNELSLFTSIQPCTMRDNGGSGKTRPGLDCVRRSNERGCGVNAPDGTFDKPVNDNRGGIWATQVEADGIKTWFFARGHEPLDIGSDSPDPSKWGTPVMNFVPDHCDMQTAFRKMKIVINISFCGSHAGGEAWDGYTHCAKQTGVHTCEEYVAKNPNAFADVYFLINSVKIYEKMAYEGSMMINTVDGEALAKSTRITVPRYTSDVTSNRTVASSYTGRPTSTWAGGATYFSGNPTSTKITRVPHTGNSTSTWAGGATYFSDGPTSLKTVVSRKNGNSTSKWDGGATYYSKAHTSTNLSTSTLIVGI